jgi:hypothetical protein
MIETNWNSGAMEGQVQTPTTEHGNAAAGTTYSDGNPEAAGLIPDEGARQSDELKVLVAGFATGLSVAGIFLIYIVLEAAKLLP